MFASFAYFLQHPRHSLTITFSPLHPRRVVRALRTAGACLYDPWVRMRILGRFRSVRRFVSLVSRVRSSPATLLATYDLTRSAFEDLDVQTAIRCLKTDGIYVGLKLPHTLIDEVKSYAEHATCYGNGDKTCGFQNSRRADAEAQTGRRFVTSFYFNNRLSCPAIARLVLDEKLQAIAAGYLGRKPVFLGSQVWWSYAENSAPCGRIEYGQTYHFDLDDYAFVKFFFYLTDVDERSGPHVYVRGTTRRLKLRHQRVVRRMSDEEVESVYGTENVQILCGKAGDGFVEDTYGIHKGIPPTGRDRLLLQIQYGLTDYRQQSDEIDPRLLHTIEC